MNRRQLELQRAQARFEAHNRRWQHLDRAPTPQRHRRALDWAHAYLRRENVFMLRWSPARVAFDDLVAKYCGTA